MLSSLYFQSKQTWYDCASVKRKFSFFQRNFTLGVNFLSQSSGFLSDVRASHFLASVFMHFSRKHETTLCMLCTVAYIIMIKIAVSQNPRLARDVTRESSLNILQESRVENFSMF